MITLRSFANLVPIATAFFLLPLFSWGEDIFTMDFEGGKIPTGVVLDAGFDQGKKLDGPSLMSLAPGKNDAGQALNVKADVSGGASHWHVSVVVPIKGLGEQSTGKLKWVFDAKSDLQCPIIVRIVGYPGKDGSKNGSLNFETLLLTPEWKTFELPLESAVKNNNFDFAAPKAAVFIGTTKTQAKAIKEVSFVIDNLRLVVE